MIEHESYPMLSPAIEKTSINIVNGAAELVSIIPPSVWSVIIGWYLLRSKIISHNRSKIANN